MNALDTSNKSLFLSYSRVQKKWCDELYIAIDEETNFQRWRDNKIPESSDWWNTICLHIEGCFAFVAILSQEYLESAYCMGELDYAIKLNKPIIALMLQDVAYPPSLDKQRLQFARVNDLEMPRVINKVLNACNQITLEYTQGNYSLEIHPRPRLRPPVPALTKVQNAPQEDQTLSALIEELSSHGQIPTLEIIKMPSEETPITNQVTPRQFTRLQLTCHREQQQDTNQRKHISVLRYLSPTKLLMGHYNGTIALWDKQRNSIYPTTPMPAEDDSGFPMHSIAATSDGQYIAYPLPRNEIQIMDFSLKKLLTLKTEDRPISLAFSPDNEWLVVGFDETGWLELWNVKEGFRRVVTYFKAHSGRVNDVQFHPTKPIFVTISSSENVIKLWAIDDGNIVAEKEKV